MNVFKKVPIPICAVILGMFGLGNLLQSYSEGVRLLCGAVGAVLMVMFLIRVLPVSYTHLDVYKRQRQHRR